MLKNGQKCVEKSRRKKYEKHRLKPKLKKLQVLQNQKNHLKEKNNINLQKYLIFFYFRIIYDTRFGDKSKTK